MKLLKISFNIRQYAYTGLKLFGWVTLLTCLVLAAFFSYLVFYPLVGSFGSALIIVIQYVLISIIYLISNRNDLLNLHLELNKKMEDIENLFRKSEHKYRSLVELSPESIVVHDLGVINYINAAGRKMLGLSEEKEYFAKQFNYFIQEDYKEMVESKLALLDAKQQSVFSLDEVGIVRSDKSFFIAEIHSSRIMRGGKISIQTVINDISERKELEKIKTEFVTLTSHQLKTPLSSLMLAVDLLNRGAAGCITPEIKEYLDDMHDSIVRMDDTIKSMLRFSRFEVGVKKTKLEEIDMVSDISSVIDDVRLLLDKKNIEISTECGSDLKKIVGDKNAIKLIFENLISNSVRYSKAGGRVIVKLQNQDQGVLISVKDDGCGIPEQDKAKIFAKSFRSDNAKAISNSGTGLGLYMVKSIVDKIQGKIWFESEVDKGSTFYVLIN